MHICIQNICPSSTILSSNDFSSSSVQLRADVQAINTMNTLLSILFCCQAVFGLGVYQRQENVFHIEAPLPEENLWFWDHPDYAMPVPEMVRSYGYTCEIHEYTTSDGYINTLHRILPRVSDPSMLKHRSVFLQHGLMGTSADYVMGSPAKSLGYLLAAEGYDVWLGNARGNKYSRKHKTFSLDSNAYWRFSFDEMGNYDLPVALSYVRSLGNGAEDNQKVFYVGHSMGTMMFWVAMHEHEQWMNDNVEMMVGMGPVARVDHIKSPIKILAPWVHQLEYLFDLLGVKEFVPSNRLMQLFDEIACDATMRQLKLCESFIFLLTGFDAQQMNMTMMPIILGHEPGGGSTQTLIHFAQLINARKFQKFDYGAGNARFYNQTSPPQYDLGKVTLPVSLMWSDNDWLADPTDVKKSLFSLPNLLDNYRVPLPKFNHVDFIWGTGAPELVYSKIFKYFKKKIE